MNKKGEETTQAWSLLIRIILIIAIIILLASITFMMVQKIIPK